VPPLPTPPALRIEVKDVEDDTRSDSGTLGMKDKDEDEDEDEDDADDENGGNEEGGSIGNGELSRSGAVKD